MARKPHWPSVHCSRTAISLSNRASDDPDMQATTANVFYFGTSVPFDEYNQKTGGSGLHLGQLNDSIGRKGAGKRSFELHVYKRHSNIPGYFQYDRESDHHGHRFEERCFDRHIGRDRRHIGRRSSQNPELRPSMQVRDGRGTKSAAVRGRQQKRTGGTFYLVKN